MNVDRLFESLLAIPKSELTFWQEMFMRFYRAWFEADRWQTYFKGLGVTLEVTVIALSIGVVLGVLVASIRVAHDQQYPGNRNIFLSIADKICKLYVTVIRGTPMTVQLLIWGLVVFASSREFNLVGALGLGINSGAYVAEIIRGGLMSLDPGQTEAGRSLGLGYIDTMRFIVIPQGFKAILPSLGNEFIVLLKDTSLLTVIAGKEIVYFAKSIGSNTYDYMFPLLITAVMYLIMVLIFSRLQSRLERRLQKSDRR
ncbi:MAG: amino acid ABC transporter permease [Oscillospiraceae bacterium]|nr:amino acid ABC transporter permease [Oscillospiraceae bacterium]